MRGFSFRPPIGRLKSSQSDCTSARSEIDSKKPNRELIDNENPEWTDEDLSRAVPFSALPAELRKLLSDEKHIKHDAETRSKRKSAA
jgi:hypothetical protein